MGNIQKRKGAGKGESTPINRFAAALDMISQGDLLAKITLRGDLKKESTALRHLHFNSYNPTLKIDKCR
jgi:hypothetical protein